MEKSSQIEIEEKIIDDMANFYSHLYKRFFNLFERKFQEIENQSEDPKFFGHITWKTAAHRLGENLFDSPAEAYYNLSPLQWIELALKELKKRDTKNNSNDPKHKDVLTSKHSDGTNFHAIYLHKDHLLFLDWLINHAREHTNHPYSLKLASEVKDATSALCKKIEAEEYEERNGFLRYCDF